VSYTPRTNGKAARLIQTLLREWAYVRPYRPSAWRQRALPRYLRHYNRARPHASLNFTAPLSRLKELAA
jgi:transposase InsO family protein